MLFSDQAFVLKKSPSGESFHLLTLFMRSNGLRYTLMREPRTMRSAQAVPDLFERAEVVIEQKRQDGPSYLKETRTIASGSGLANSYSALEAASHLSSFYEKNLLHLERFEEAWLIFENALMSFQEADRPEVTLLKALVLFARSEGYPVIARWFSEKSPADQKALGSILRSPVQEAQLSQAEVKAHTRDLLRFFARDTDLLPGQLFDNLERCQ